MDNDLDTLKETDPIQDQMWSYSAKISSSIHNRLERHVLVLRKLIDKNISKQIWLHDAIREKLTNDGTTTDKIPKECSLNLRIDKELEKQIQKRIEFIRKFRKSYSKKQWFLEAILEKLDREEKAVESKMSEMEKTPLETLKQNTQLQVELSKLLAQLLENQPS